MTLEKFIEKEFKGLNFLKMSDERYHPGIVLNKEDDIVDNLNRYFLPPEKWKTIKRESTITGETVQDEKNLDAGVKFLGVFEVKAGGTSAYSVSFEFEKTSVMVFENLYENEILEQIDNLKETDKERWKKLLHQFVIMESVYVETFRATLKKNGNALTSADVVNLQGEISVSGNYSWNSSGEMVITNNKNPLGVKGFKIQRF